VQELLGLVTAPRRRAWAIPLFVAAVLLPVMWRLDPLITGWLTSIKLGGDVRREFEALQQYGQGVSTFLVALVIWLQDPGRRRRLADWAAALIVAGIAVNAVKLLVGRPRPKYGDPDYLLGPFGQYPVDRVVNGDPVGIRHAWEIWSGISSDLWSMPSSHTAYAVLMAVAVGSMYPRLRVLVAVLAGLVALGRVMTNAHYASDVLVGAAIGLAIGRAAMQGMWGDRVLKRWQGQREAVAMPEIAVRREESPAAREEVVSAAGGGERV
jgi:membrane-associated phospholipid phosphatase